MDNVEQEDPEVYLRILSLLKLVAQIQHGYTKEKRPEDAKPYIENVQEWILHEFDTKARSGVRPAIEKTVAEVALRQHAVSLTIMGDLDEAVPEIEKLAKQLYDRM